MHKIIKLLKFRLIFTVFLVTLASCWLIFETGFLVSFLGRGGKLWLGVIIIYSLSLLGVIGLLLPIIDESNYGRYGKVLSFCRENRYLFIAATFWPFVFLLAREIARYYIRFLAFDITGSFACPECRTSQEFNWDISLQLATYVSYALFMVILSIILIKIYRSNCSNFFKRFALFVYILLFPTYISWGVHSLCGGISGCSVGYYVDVVGPIILSTQLSWSTVISLGLACCIIWAYFRIEKLACNT